MTLKEQIMGLTIDDRELSEEEIFSKVIKAFAHDYTIDEDIIDEYVEVFGEESRELFSFLSDNEDQLDEFVLEYDGNILEATEGEIGKFYLLNERLKDDTSFSDDRKKENFEKTFGSRSENLMNKQKEALAAQSAYKADDAKETIKSRITDLSDNKPKTFGSAYSASLDPSKGEYGKMYTASRAGDSKINLAEPAVKSPDAVTPDTVHKSPVSTSMKTAAVAKTAVTKGFLAKLWDKIKHFGGGIRAYFLQHPGLLKTLGIAGGVGAGILAIRKLMKNARENKQAKESQHK